HCSARGPRRTELRTTRRRVDRQRQGNVDGAARAARSGRTTPSAMGVDRNDLAVHRRILSRASRRRFSARDVRVATARSLRYISDQAMTNPAGEGEKSAKTVRPKLTRAGRLLQVVTEGGA